MRGKYKERVTNFEWLIMPRSLKDHIMHPPALVSQISLGMEYIIGRNQHTLNGFMCFIVGYAITTRLFEFTASSVSYGINTAVFLYNCIFNHCNDDSFNG